MAQVFVRDPHGREFPIDPSARPFWECREGHTILDQAAEPGNEPELEQPGIPTTTTTTRKAAVRAAQDAKEQPGG